MVPTVPCPDRWMVGVGPQRMPVAAMPAVLVAEEPMIGWYRAARPLTAAPGASVTATNLASGTSRATTTNDVGLFRFVAMPPGRYTVTVEMQGFKPLKVEEFTLLTSDNRDFAKLTLQALIAELSARGPKKNPGLVEEIRTGKEAFLAKFRPWMESNETPINPYRVLGDMMKALDPKNSFVTADSGNTRDQTSTVYEAQIPRGLRRCAAGGSPWCSRTRSARSIPT